MKKRELLGFIVVVSLFFILMVKYYYPGNIQTAGDAFLEEFFMNADYVKYELETKNLLIDVERGLGDANSIPVLLYHGLGKVPNEKEISLANFKDQMFALKAAGYNTITLEEFKKFMEEGEGVPDKSFLLTFDDGIKSSYYLSDPILRALDYNAVMFIITKYSLEGGSSYYLSLEEVEKMLN